MSHPVSLVKGVVVPLDMDDVDTDQIFPAQFLNVTSRRGIGRYLFYRWRHSTHGRSIGSFALDEDRYAGARILVTGKRFGIGSSRETAIWALLDFGIECVIAPSFGEMFYSSASINGLLCVRLKGNRTRSIMQRAKKGNLELSVDLKKQAVTCGKASLKFDIEPYVKDQLLGSADGILSTSRGFDQEISKFEARMPSFLMPRRGEPSEDSSASPSRQRFQS